MLDIYECSAFDPGLRERLDMNGMKVVPAFLNYMRSFTETGVTFFYDGGRLETGLVLDQGNDGVAEGYGKLLEVLEEMHPGKVFRAFGNRVQERLFYKIMRAGAVHRLIGPERSEYGLKVLNLKNEDELEAKVYLKLAQRRVVSMPMPVQMGGPQERALRVGFRRRESL